VKGNMKNI